MTYIYKRKNLNLKKIQKSYKEKHSVDRKDYFFSKKKK